MANGVVRWKFFDLNELEEYIFEVNPSEGGSPQFVKSVEYQSTVAPDGRTLLFEGSDEPVELEWSGVILSQEHHETFVDWFHKRHPILLTDDLGRERMVYIIAYEPQRERAVHHPYKHSYTMRAVTLDWPPGE